MGRCPGEQAQGEGSVKKRIDYMSARTITAIVMFVYVLLIAYVIWLGSQ